MPKAKTKKPTVRQLQSSRLHVKQLEGLREDIDLEHLNIKVGGKSVLNLRTHMTEGSIERTIEGASTVNVSVADQSGAILRSRVLQKTSDIKIDGLWFRLVKIDKSGDTLNLTWEDREVAIMRNYTKVKIIAKNIMTRAQFVRVLCKEVREVPIRLMCPDLHKGKKLTGVVPEVLPQGIGIQPLGLGDPGNPSQHGRPRKPPADKDKERRPGFPPNTNKSRRYADDPPMSVRVTVQGHLADKSQLRNIATAIDVGLEMGARTKVIICAIMTMTVEAHCRNPKGGDGDSVGAFQQIAAWGWPASRDVAIDAQAFYAAAMEIDKDDPTRPYGVLCQSVQNSAYPDRYAVWFEEAAHTVKVYGAGNWAGTGADNNQSQWGGQTADDKTNWIRGTTATRAGKQVMKRESSWTCIGRLADDIGYRRFMLNGTLYFISEPALFASRPRMLLSQDSQGVDWIDFDYDVRKRNATITITAHLHRWDAPPGSVVQIEDMGIVDGKWLVTTIRRDIFDSKAEITCKKPRAVIPEPAVVSYGPAPVDPKGGGTEVGSVRQVAARILEYHKNGRYRDDNGSQLSQLEKMAAGKKLLNQCGSKVYMDPRVLSFLLWLLDNSIMVGTFAFVEDHYCNQGQHPLGQAVDISSLGENLRWYPLNTPNVNARRLAMDVMQQARDFGAWDLICNGIGKTDPAVQKLQIDNGKTRGGTWETDHIDHMHYSVAPGRRHN